MAMNQLKLSMKSTGWCGNYYVKNTLKSRVVQSFEAVHVRQTGREGNLPKDHSYH